MSDFERQRGASLVGAMFTGWGEQELERSLDFAFVVEGLCVCYERDRIGRQHTMGGTLSGRSEPFCLLVNDCGEKEMG